MSISKSQNVVPTREERLHTVIAYGGTGEELVRNTKRKCLKQLDRGFSQCAACDEMMPLCNSALIEGNVVVAHSPIGCASMLESLTMFKNIGRNLRGQAPDIIKSISTNLGENTVVYGGAADLEQAILEAERRYHPPMITVITSCASGIIGDDIDGVVAKVQPNVKATIVPMHCEGFRSGVVSTGYDAFLIGLMKVIEEPKKKRSDTLLIVNPFTIARANEVEIERLLTKIGIKAQWFPLFTDVENIRNAAEVGGIATLCNLMSNYFVREMNRKYNIPYADPAMPVGIEFTGTWLREVAKLFGKEKEAERVIAEEEARIRPKVNELKAQLKGKRAYIGFNLAKSLGLQSLIQELGLETVVTTGFEYSDDYGLKAFESLNKRCGGKKFTVHIGNFQHFEWINLFRKEKPDVLVGGLEHAGSAMREGIPVAAVLPDTLYAGYEGVVSYGTKITKALKNASFPRNLSKHVVNPYRESWYSENAFKYIGGDGQ